MESLYRVVQKGDLNELKKKFQKEDVNKTFGNSLLHVASFCNHPHVVQFLLDNGSDPFQRNLEGKMSEELTSNPEILALLRIYRKRYLRLQKKDEQERKELNRTPVLDLSDEFKRYEFTTPSKNKSLSNIEFAINERDKSKDKYYSVMDEKIRENIHLSLDNERWRNENQSLRREIQLLNSNLRELTRMKTEYIINKNELVKSKLLLDKTISDNRSIQNESKKSIVKLHKFKRKYKELEKTFIDLRNRTVNDTRNFNQTLDLNSEKLGRSETENKKIREAYSTLRGKYKRICSQYCVNE